MQYFCKEKEQTDNVKDLNVKIMIIISIQHPEVSSFSAKACLPGLSSILSQEKAILKWKLQVWWGLGSHKIFWSSQGIQATDQNFITGAFKKIRFKLLFTSDCLLCWSLERKTYLLGKRKPTGLREKCSILECKWHFLLVVGRIVLYIYLIFSLYLMFLSQAVSTVLSRTWWI